jgi:hypothetical protein
MMMDYCVSEGLRSKAFVEGLRRLHTELEEMRQARAPHPETVAPGHAALASSDLMWAAPLSYVLTSERVRRDREPAAFF